MTRRSIHEFAALRAEILRTGDLGAAIERAGLQPNDWTALEDDWQAALAREAATGGRALSAQYLAAFRRPDGRESDAAQGLPTYLIAQQGAPVAVRSVPVEAASPPVGPVLRPGLPVLSIQQYAWVSATLTAATAAELPAALAKLRLTIETRAELEAAWNAFLNADGAARTAFMLALGREFEGRPSPPVAPLQPAVQQQASLPRMTVALREGSGATAGPDPDETHLGGVATGRALPFVPDAMPGPEPPPHPARKPERSPLAGRTAFGSSGARPSLPFARGKGPNPPDLPPGWTLARYAALSIDLYASGMPADEVLRVAGLTRAQLKALDAYWEARMFEEPSLRAEWKAFADARQAELKK